MNIEITKATVISSLFWKFTERMGVQGIQFVVSIILARILSPEDFGTIVLITIFIAISGVLVQGGFNTALIQKRDVDDLDYSSVFYLNLFVSGLIYTGLFFASPFIAEFYKEPQLVYVLRFLSLTLLFAPFNSIQNAVLGKKMHFKKLSISNLGAIVISGTVGIVMAYCGYGVWALVLSQLTNQFFITLILWFTVKWRPKLLFSVKRVKMLFSFGWKLVASALIDTLYLNVQSLIIGKMFSPAMLGIYNKGEQFPSLIVSNINGSIQSVMLPAMASNQDNKEKVKEMVRRSIVTSSFVIFPMMMGLAIVGEPLVRILLTEKWLPAVPFLQIFCASYALWPIHTTNLQAINALGRSDIFLKLEIIKKVLGIIILGLSIPYGVYGMALGTLIGGIISSLINAYPNSKLLNYSIQEQWQDIIPSFILSVFMGAGVYAIKLLGFSDVFTLILQMLIGIFFYFGMAQAYKLECFIYIVSTVKQILKRKKAVYLTK
ncbi:lipopolysaccharide biosynthesis protein [Neobacillus sp. YIM B06451]|uniref:lipopolysaccharide biosynthesis protein n=1 Tax=Neobacillus sp. YIM B06451 TaxID=3070994 RepID=UPI002931C6E3|nr:lipopolysaccharide biosynthesis protein [Neobacillus sp. YIM B06451]